MRRRLLVPASLAASLTLFAQALFAQIPISAPRKPTEQVSASCTVSGRVVTAAEGSPLQSARVTLIQQHAGSHPPMYAATSDANGHFTLKDIVPGRYDFRAARNSYVDQRYQSDGADSGALLSLRPGQEVADVIFRLTIAAVIAGRVTNEDGAAMVRARVVALRKSTEDELVEEGLPASKKLEVDPVAAAQTDDRGQYRIFGLEPGEYYLRAADSYEPDPNIPVDQYYFIRQVVGSDYASVFYPGVPQLGQAQPISLGAGEEAQADIVMRQVKTVEISGHVVGPRGSPAADVSVNLEEAEAEGYSSLHDTSTDAKGDFSLKGIPPGSYILLAYQHLQEEGRAYHAQQNLEVGSDNIDSITLALGGGANLAGRVTVVGPVSVQRDRILVSLNPVGEGGSWGGSGRVKKDGSFEIADVKEGNYAVFVRGPDESWFAKSVRLGPDDVLANGLHVEKGSSGGTLEIVVTTGGAMVEGSVTQDDKPAAGVRVRITPDPETPYNKVLSQSVRTDQNGRFSLQIAPGKFQVIARSRGPNGRLPRASDPRSVNVSEHDHKTLDLTIAPGTK